MLHALKDRLTVKIKQKGVTSRCVEYQIFYFKQKGYLNLGNKLCHINYLHLLLTIFFILEYNAKKCLYEGVIVPTALYGVVAWGMRSAERRKVNVLEMKCLRSLVGVS